MKHWKLALVTLLALITALALGAACAEAAEFTYTPDDDLLLCEWEGIKIWLPGKQSDESFFYSYGVNPGEDYYWSFFNLFEVRIDNETDQEYEIHYSCEIDGYAMRQEGSFPGNDFIPANESSWSISIFGTASEMAEANGLSGSEVRNIINNAKVVVLDLSICTLTDEDESFTTLHDFDPIAIRFQSESSEAIETPADVESSADIESLYGTWIFHSRLDADGTTYDETAFIEEGYKPEELKYILGPGYLVYEETGQYFSDHYGFKDIDGVQMKAFGEWQLSNDGQRLTLSSNMTIAEQLSYAKENGHEYTPPTFLIHSDDNDLITMEGPKATVTYKRAAAYDPSLDALYAQGNDDEATAEAQEAPAEAVEAEAPEQTDSPGEVHKDKATVKAAQQALNEAGYDCGTPDGVAGKNTKSAISSYQTDKGLTVTGTVTDELLASLGLN